MNPTWAFLCDVGIAVSLFLGTVAYIQRHLRTLLIELCETAERANFWLAFSNVALVVVPLIFALDYQPDFAPGKSSAIFEMATQIKHSLTGFVITLCVLAFILLRFINRGKISATEAFAQPSGPRDVPPAQAEAARVSDKTR